MVVPSRLVKKVLRIFPKAKKKIVVVKNGDHSLSSKKNIRKILKELDRLRVPNL